MNRTKQLLGKSNKFFYYHMSQGASFDIRYTIEIKNLDLDILRSAVSDALIRYPEFATTTVISNNVFTSVHNDRPVLFVTRDDKVRHFSTDETNGYLFYFGYSGDSFTMYYYHGLSDIVGMMSFIRCYLFLYGEKTGFNFTEEETEEIKGLIRNSDEVFAKGNQTALLDPYGTYGDSTAVPEYQLENLGAFTLPTSDYPEEAEYLHEVVLHTSTSAFLAKTKELGVSVIPLLNDIISGAMCRKYTPGDMPIIAMVPVNLRVLFESETVVNCSDGIRIPYYAADLEKPLRDRCQMWKGYLKNQMNIGLYKKIMGDKAGTVDRYEADAIPIVEQAKTKTKLPPKDFIRPMSYALTYPGKLNMSKGLDRMITDFDFHGLGRGTSIVVHTYGDKMGIQIVYRKDDNELSDIVIRAFQEYDFEVKAKDNGRVYPNRMDVDRLEIMS